MHCCPWIEEEAVPKSAFIDFQLGHCLNQKKSVSEMTKLFPMIMSRASPKGSFLFNELCKTGGGYVLHDRAFLSMLSWCSFSKRFLGRFISCPGVHFCAASTRGITGVENV